MDWVLLYYVGTVLLNMSESVFWKSTLRKLHAVFKCHCEHMKLVLEQRIAHAGHPVLRWMMDNIYVRTDPAGNIKPDKEKSTEKIDGAVATIMALDRAIRCENDTTESVYDTRGLLFL